MNSWSRRLVAAAAALSLASCHMLPGHKAEPAPEPVAPPPVSTADQKPLPQAAAATTSETRLYPGHGHFVMDAPPLPKPPPGPEEASLNFEALDVREVAKVILGDYLKESYTVHPSVSGTVTFRTIKPIPRRELLPTLEMLLRQNNAALVIEEGIHKVVPISMVRGSVSPRVGGPVRAIPPGFSIVVVPLKFVSAREMMRILEPFASDNTVRVDEVRNMIILAGHQREMKHMIDTIEMFDVDWLAGYSVGLFPIKSADVKALVADMEKVFGAGAASPLAGIVRVIPIERLNALLVVTTQPKYLETARTWVERIDQLGGTSGGSRFFVYYVKNGKAENLAQLIGDLFAGKRTTSAPSLAPGQRPAEIRSPTGMTTPGLTPGSAPISAPAAASFNLQGGAGSTASEVRVIADKDTNSLLVLATPADYDVIESALRKLDVIPRQVLVEVLLAEVSMSDELEFGISWFINANKTNPNRTIGRIDTFPGSLPPTPADIAGVPFGVGRPFQLVSISADAVRAVLNARGEDNKARVLATPQLMVLDNQKGQIKVGDRISVQTQSQTGVSTGTGVLNSFQYLETGILLALTPRINSNNQVTLEVSQEVSNPKPSTPGTNPDVSQRTVQTTVVVGSGESIVFAGLIREDTGRSSVGVPLLSKIPVLGAAFGSQAMNRGRTELVMIITPRIISDSRQAQEASEELRTKLPMLQDVIKSFMVPPPPDPKGPAFNTPAPAKTE